jgi:hypothetical protein
VEEFDGPAPPLEQHYAEADLPVGKSGDGFIPQADLRTSVVGASLGNRRPRPLRGDRRSSDVDLLGDFDRIIYFNAEIANRALDLGMPEQELNRP